MSPDHPDFTATLRIVEPYPGVFAYYDGRIDGRRLYSDAPNWLDDGAYSLGIASYAIVDGAEALVYDTHMSLAHARAIRRHLEGLGVTSMRVALSHHHDDHIAGNEVFADCPIIALKLTADLMIAKQHEMETATPPISPVVMPTQTFETRLDLSVGGRAVELHHFDIHSIDGAVLWLPHVQVLLAGDALEDTITYLAEPTRLAAHLTELQRMAGWPIARILPNHGEFERIAAGGYAPSLITATQAYVARLIGDATTPVPADLREAIAPELATGAVIYYGPYEEVHSRNLGKLRARRS